MKEFEKKPNPSREPASEGMKGLSKFLPMTDSNYRRRLTEYEVQVQDLQTYVRSLVGAHLLHPSGQVQCHLRTGFRPQRIQ